MDNNDILRRLRYTFDFSDDKMMAIFSLAENPVTRAQISDWLKKEDDPALQQLSDPILATFLNGFIIDRRGRKDGPLPAPEKRLGNNAVLVKLKIALNLQAEDILAVLAVLVLSGVEISSHELSAFFRKSGHKHYRECKDQILRNFIHGLQLKYRESTE